jgi:hypothetical protein
MLSGGIAVKEPISHPPHVTNHERTAPADDELNQIRDSLRGLRFGSVNIIVQDGVVIQIDRTEKRRLRGNRTN